MDQDGGNRRSRRGSRHVQGYEQQWPPSGEASDVEEEAEADEEDVDEEEVALLMSTFDRCRPRADGTVDARCVCTHASHVEGGDSKKTLMCVRPHLHTQ